MWQVPSTTLHSTARSFHVDPEKVAQEGLLQVVVYLVVVDDPQQFIHTQNGLTHRLDETVLTLQ